MALREAEEPQREGGAHQREEGARQREEGALLKGAKSQRGEGAHQHQREEEELLLPGESHLRYARLVYLSCCASLFVVNEVWLHLNSNINSFVFFSNGSQLRGLHVRYHEFMLCAPIVHVT